MTMNSITVPLVVLVALGEVEAVPQRPKKLQRHLQPQRRPMSNWLDLMLHRKSKSSKKFDPSWDWD